MLSACFDAMEIEAIINEAADEADDFLSGMDSVAEARAMIKEHLQDHHPELEADEIDEVTSGVLSVLREEGSFDHGAGVGDTWDDAEAREQ